MLCELGAPFDYTSKRMPSPGGKVFNPNDRLVTLQDGSSTIYGSTPILTYLADKHAKFTAPAGSVGRAHQDQRMHFVLQEIEGALRMSGRHSFILPPERRVPEVRQSLKWEFRQSTIPHLEKMLEGSRFLCGEQLTFADIILADCLDWAENARFLIGSATVIEYHDQLQERAGFIQAALRLG